MTPNLRFNKKLTRKLIKAIPTEENAKPTLMSIEWNMENKNNVFGLRYTGFFKETVFFLQRTEPNRYRLVVSDGTPLCSFYIIDDIEQFLETIGIEILELEDTLEIHKALEETIMVPNTGIIVINENEVYVYEHENY